MDGAVKPDTIICKLKVPLPESVWIKAFSMDHPENIIDVLGHLSTGSDETTVDIVVHGDSAFRLKEVLAEYPGVKNTELIAMEGDKAHYRVVHTSRSLLEVLRRFHLMPRYPFTICAGVATWVIVGREEKLRSLYMALNKLVPGVLIESLKHSSLDKPLRMLTGRQQEILYMAMRSGYYEVPRKVSLTELAGRMGLAKSTLSESLATIERKLLKEITERPGVFS